MSTSPRTPRKGSTDQVYTRLRELIVTGELEPGARVVERDVAKRLGVSRTPVREAVQRLQYEGLIVPDVAKKYSRPFVAALTEQDARDLHEVAAGLEVIAARRAAQLAPGPRQELAADMQERNEQLRVAAGSDAHDIGDILELDHAFHRTYVAAVGGPRLAELRRLVKPQLERYVRRYPAALQEDITLEAVREHGAIVAAVRDGDAEATERAVRVNWRNGYERLRRIIAAAEDEPLL